MKIWPHQEHFDQRLWWIYEILKSLNNTVYKVLWELFSVIEWIILTNKVTLVQSYYYPWNSERIVTVSYILGQGTGNYTDKSIQN